MRPEDSDQEAVNNDGMKYDSRDRGPLPEDQYPGRAEEENSEAMPVEEDGERRLLQRAASFFRESTDYLEASVFRTWEDSLKHFRGEHASGSRYHNPSNKARSRLFRPKTRAAIKNHEAAFAAAAFTNQDLVDIAGKDPNNPVSAAAGKLTKALIQHRMSHSLNWLLTALGAWQDTHVYGACVSRQEWEYEEWEDLQYELATEMDDEGNEYMVVDPNTGEPMAYESRVTRVVSDKPTINLIALENFRFNVNADWRDPVGTSDCIVEMIPMLAGDVLDQMDKIDPKTGEPVWRRYSLDQILSAGGDPDSNDDAVKRARSGRERQDPEDAHVHSESSPVWVHLNVVRERGQDYVFWSIGTRLPLTTPVPIEEVYPLGRPWRFGICNIEAHRTLPSSTAEQGHSLQVAINDVTNQRFDNVKLALNKRYFIRRQTQGGIDLAALMRNVPGGGVMLDDPEKDVRIVETNDVTSSSYTEQDRFSVEFDSLVGNFSQDSVMNNRRLNETVGGMNLMSSGANSIQELAIRIFIETWMLPVIRDLVKLEQMYETDETILALAGEKAELFKTYKQEFVTADLLKEDLLVSVNVGMGHTNPAQKVEKLSLALNTLANIPGVVERLNADELSKEVFSYVGHADGERFLLPVEEVQGEPPPDPMVEIKREEIQLKRERLEADMELAWAKIEVDREHKYATLALQEGKTMAEIEARLDMDIRRDQTLRDMTAARESNKAREMKLKQQMGEGI